MDINKKDLLFSVTKKDFDIQFFRAGGPGGQKVNKTSSACRITHKASGAVGESREQRHQAQNKKLAFERLVNSKKFQLWLKMEVGARLQGYADAEAKVKDMMQEENLKVEYYEPK